MKICVVALGKIGLPLAVQFADRATRSSASTSTRRRSTRSTPAREPFPGEAHLQEKLVRARAGRPPARHHRLRRRGARRRRRRLVVPLFVDDATGEPDFGWMDAATRSLAEHLTPGTLVSYETTLPVGTTRDAAGSRCSRRARASPRATDFHLVFSPERVLTGRVFADLRKYPKLIGGLSRGRRRRGAASSTRPCSTSTSAPTSQRRNGVWDLGSRRGRRDGQARRDHLPRRQHRPGEPVRAASPRPRASTSTRSSRRATPSRTATSTGPASPSAATASRCTRGSTCATDPDATSCAPRARPNAAMPELHRRPARGRPRRPRRASASSCSAPPTAAGSRRPRSPASSRPSRRSTARGATVLVHDPLYTDEELARLGFDAVPPRRAGRRRGRAGRPRRVPQPGPGRPAGAAHAGRRAPDHRRPRLAGRHPPHRGGRTDAGHRRCAMSKQGRVPAKVVMMVGNDIAPRHPRPEDGLDARPTPGSTSPSSATPRQATTRSRRLGSMRIVRVPVAWQLRDAAARRRVERRKRRRLNVGVAPADRRVRDLRRGTAAS